MADDARTLPMNTMTDGELMVDILDQVKVGIDENTVALKEGLSDLVTMFDDFFERLAFQQEVADDPLSTGDQAGTGVKGKDSLFGEAMSALGGFNIGEVIGLAMIGWAAGIDDFLQLKLLPQIFKNTLAIFSVDKIAGLAVPYFEGIKDIFNKAGTGQILKGATREALGSFTNLVRDTADFFANLNKQTAVFKPIIASFDAFVATFESVGKFFGKIGEFIKMIGKFAPIAKVLSVAGGPFVMGIFALLDFVKGFLNGFAEGGVLMGLKEGALEIFRGFITEPLDLLKDIVSWLAEKLSFNNFSAALDAFSFTDLFNRFEKSVETFLVMTFNWIGELFEDPSTALNRLTSGFKDLPSLAWENAIKPYYNWLGTFVEVENAGERIEAKLGPKINWLKDFVGTFYENKIKPSVDWIQDLLSTDRSIESIVGDAADWIRDLPMKIFDWVKTLFKVGAVDPSKFDLTNLIPDLSNVELPSAEEILADVGRAVNDAFQQLAQYISESIWPLDQLAMPFAKLGSAVGEMLGATDLATFNAQTKMIDMPLGKPMGLKPETQNLQNGSREIESMKEKAQNNNVIIAPNTNSNVQNNVTNQNLSTVPASPKPSSNPGSIYNHR